jgi:hypothetical protein
MSRRIVDEFHNWPNFGSIEARLSKGHVTGQRPSKAELEEAERRLAASGWTWDKQEIQAKMEKAKQMESSPVPSNPHPMYDWPEPYDWAKQGI